MSNSLRPCGLQHARPPCPSPTPGVYSNSHSLSWWCHPIISSSVVPINLSQHQGLFQWVSSSHAVAKVLEFQLYHHSFQRNPRADLLQNGRVGSPCSPRDFQESSPTPQFKSINSSVLIKMFICCLFASGVNNYFFFRTGIACLYIYFRCTFNSLIRYGSL